MRTPALLTLLTLLAAAPALADDWVPPVTDALVQKECGSCHMAFQPAFLPARSWDKTMDTLSNHFGDDIRLEPSVARSIRLTLINGAGDRDGRGLGRKSMRGIRDDQTPLTITETPYFIRKHRLDPAAWKNPKVLTKSNCPACHHGAERGLYEED